MSERPEEIDALDRMTTELRERSDQFLVVVKDAKGTFAWRTSCKTWGMGAAMRVLESLREQERMDTNG